MERTRDGVSSVSSGHHGAIVHFVLQHKMHLLVVDSVVSGTSDWLDTHYWATVAWMHVDNHVEESCCCKCEGWPPRDAISGAPGVRDHPSRRLPPKGVTGVPVCDTGLEMYRGCFGGGRTSVALEDHRWLLDSLSG